jgi:hypothetical protein
MICGHVYTCQWHVCSICIISLTLAVITNKPFMSDIFSLRVYETWSWWQCSAVTFDRWQERKRREKEGRQNEFCWCFHKGGIFVYYESIKRELQTRPIYECRCDERLKTKVEESTRLVYTGLLGELEHLKIETRLLGRVGRTLMQRKSTFILLWIKKARATDKTYIWGSLRWKTKKLNEESTRLKKSVFL